MKHVPASIILSLALTVLIFACDDDAGTGPSDDDSGVTVTEALASGCHGFAAGKAAEDIADETLNWTYEPETKSLTLHHAVLYLNCCGVHGIDAVYADGIVTIYEDDQPEPEHGRCLCVCPFDFLITLEGIPEESTGVRIMLTVDDETVEHWAGAIDPAGGQGTIVIADRTGIQ